MTLDVEFTKYFLPLPLGTLRITTLQKFRVVEKL